MITAIGGIASATADITTAAVTEYSRTTAQASTNKPTQRAIKAKYSRFRTVICYPEPRWIATICPAVPVTEYRHRCRVAEANHQRLASQGV